MKNMERLYEECYHFDQCLDSDFGGLRGGGAEPVSFVGTQENVTRQLVTICKTISLISFFNHSIFFLTGYFVI
jgi:hypothetical protein